MNVAIECFMSCVRSTDERTWPARPAPCDVVTLARESSLSMRRRSFLPALASEYAAPVPTAPPPMTTISASPGLELIAWLFESLRDTVLAVAPLQAPQR